MLYPLRLSFSAKSISWVFLPYLTLCVLSAGPKLRKWYGQDEWMPRDGGFDIDGPTKAPDEEEPEDGPRDAVLVTHVDSPTGEQVVLQLVLAR